MSVKIIKKNETLFAIEGELNMQTVPEASKLLAKLMAESSSSNNLALDLALVSRSDSAGVALLIDVMQLAKTAKMTLIFSNLPQQMQDIAGISGLADILPVSENSI
jgi:phospholipid transport system transporter-binding protein